MKYNINGWIFVIMEGQQNLLYVFVADDQFFTTVPYTQIKEIPTIESTPSQILPTDEPNDAMQYNIFECDYRLGPPTH